MPQTDLNITVNDLIAEEMSKRYGVQPPLVLGQLRAAAIQLRNDTRVRNGLEAVLRTDVAIKSSAGTPQHLLECLAVELCAR